MVVFGFLKFFLIVIFLLFVFFGEVREGWKIIYIDIEIRKMRFCVLLNEV